MEEKHRILSLRRKRTQKPKPVISAPRQISAPISNPIIESTPYASSMTLDRPHLAPSVSNSSLASRERPQRGGDTADYVKRRYSSRLTPQITRDLETAPPVPSLPNQFPSTPPARSAQRLNSFAITNDKIAVDLVALQDPNLRPDQYVAQLLANASEHDIREYQADLRKIKNRTSVDLSHNVYQNRSQFIKISQEADKLKSEMRVLRSLMSELTTTLGQTNAALGITTDNITARKYANRSSVANLEAMWSSHLQELWRRVEGSQKFLPAIPGRHVVHESGRWVELNTATWKPKKRVHVILLNDHLLIASEKKRGPDADKALLKPGQHQAQLVADRCHPLQDVDISEVASRAAAPAPAGKHNPPTGSAINVRIGSDALTYMAMDEGKEKAAFLARFRKSVADLRKALQSDAAGASTEDRLNGRLGGELAPPSASASGDTTPNGAPGRAPMLVEVDGRQQEFRWVESQVDELDIDIALQRFDDGVARVDTLRRIAKANKSNLLVQDLVDGKVADKAARLAKAITKQLVAKNAHMTATQQHVAWLSKLGFDNRASEAFLEARSDVVRLRISQCSDTGDLHVYLYQLSFIYFKLLRNTVAIYQACFPTSMTSAAVKWAKSHVDDFNVILARQMGKIDSGSEEWKYCIERAREHAGMLHEVGIDFGGLVGKWD